MWQPLGADSSLGLPASKEIGAWKRLLSYRGEHSLPAAWILDVETLIGEPGLLTHETDSQHRGV